MNNSFLQCISDICGLEVASLVAHGKYTVYGNSVAVIEGHNGILDYSCNNVSFKWGKQKLTVAGQSLQIRTLEKNSSVIVGQIQGVAVQNV